MLRNLSLLVLFSISSLLAKSSTATTSEADRKAQAATPPQRPTISRTNDSWNPHDYNDTQLRSLAPWLMAMDEHTITKSHSINVQGEVIRNVVCPRNLWQPSHPQKKRAFSTQVSVRRKLFS